MCSQKYGQRGNYWREKEEKFKQIFKIELVRRASEDSAIIQICQVALTDRRPRMHYCINNIRQDLEELTLLDWT